MDTLKLNALLQQHASSGVAVSLSRNGQLLYQGCAGYADRANRVPITTTTSFELASCSKQFTGYAIQLLCQQGRLRPTDFLVDYFPGFPKDLTLNHLLWHVSGLADYLTAGIFYESMTNDAVIQSIRPLPLRFALGEKFEYCNTNYAILAAVVEKVAKQPFYVFMWHNVFEPLKMNQTRIFNAPNAARGYANGFLCENPNLVCGDGNVWTTSADFGTWTRHLRSRFGTPLFTRGALANGQPVSYGYGMRLEDDCYGHDGGWAGFATGTWFYLKEDMTTSILSNDAAFDQDAFGDALVSLASIS